MAAEQVVASDERASWRLLSRSDMRTGFCADHHTMVHGAARAPECGSIWLALAAGRRPLGRPQNRSDIVLEVKLRPPTPDDLELLAEIYLTSMQDSITRARGYWNLQKEDLQFRQQIEFGGTRVLRVDNADVGFVMTRRVTVTTTEIHTLCVARGAQGKGIGASVMRELMRDADSGGTDLELSVLKESPRARQFYERLGFVEIGRSEHHVRMRRPRAA